MKANITFQLNQFDDSSKSVVIYSKFRDALTDVCFAMGKEFLLTNVFITEDKTEEKKEN